MNKKWIHILLCLLLLVSMVQPVAADLPEEEETAVPALVITDKREFLAFAENCRLDSYSWDLTVKLAADIDLTGEYFTGIPIFCGTFNGAGHTISGLDLTADGSAQGLFRYLTDTALVQDLNVRGTVHPGGSRNFVGGIAGENAGTIWDCSFTGNLSGAGYVGGIAGRNAVSGIVQTCVADGEIYGEHFVGGIVGENLGVIRASTNKAKVNTTAQQNTVNIADITVETLTSSEDANTVTDIGGIAGNSSGVIRNCLNYGDVGYKHMGYNIGGIAGTQSGYLTICQNYGSVQGRKEVGGIVGQMEPASVIKYTEDTLQILQEQLNSMGALVNRASRNAQNNASGITSRLGTLEDQTQKAKDAVESLIPDRDNPQLPDQDTLLAAENALNKSLSSMTSTMRGIASATQNTVSGLTRDLQAVSNQLGAMSNTINGAEDNIGGTITDVSDLDTELDLTGKVEGSINAGPVLGEVNVGGIAGAMAVENDIDIWEDWEQLGETSMNFDSEIRAVVSLCTNKGAVTGQKQNVGGIAGWQSVGLVKLSTNIGNLSAENANYVGGISGMSSGFIRGCGTKCEIQGSTYAGGIAGSATIVSDCAALVKMSGVSEKLGAILGQREAPTAEEENPVVRNYYLVVGEDIGAIDGINYAGQAESLPQSAFMLLEDLASVFKEVSVRFSTENGQTADVKLNPGDSLQMGQIPAVPYREGYSGVWEGLADADLANILFDMEFEAVYTPYRMTLQSKETAETGMPLALLEGSFTDMASFCVRPGKADITLEEEEVLLESWQFQASEAGHTARLWYGGDVDGLKLLVDGVETDCHMDGSYLVFELSQAEAQVYLVQPAPGIDSMLVAIAGGAALLILVIVISIVRKRKQKKAAEAQTV